MLRIPKRVVLALLMIGHPAARAQDNKFIIHDGHVGNIHPGMTVEEFYAKAPPWGVTLVDTLQEGLFSPAFKVENDGHLLMLAEIDKNTHQQWVILRLELMDARFHTVTGVAVGMSLSALKKHYPALKVISGEGSSFASVKDKGLSFRLETEPRTEPSGDPKITSIIILR
jgi:hypothetical protein